MAVRIAYETLKRIEEGVAADQGAKFRGLQGQVLPHIGDAYRTDEDGHRTHMGASLIGGECGRAIWYNFRWATKPRFGGRTLRLFNRGHLEEGRFIALMLMIGVQVFQQDANGKQYRISHANGHFGGSGDGVFVDVPEFAPGTAILGEFKTHGDESFKKLAGKNWRNHIEKGKGSFDGQGVRDAKFEHYVQMQVYMYKMGLPAALYAAVNKNTDDLYMEIVLLDKAVAEQFLDRGERLVYMDTPPKKLSESPGFFGCMFCDHKPVCHLRAEPDQNCRTCEFSEPSKTNNEWICLRINQPIPKDVQLTGCSQYARKKDF